jgi:DNA-binding NtrC family response regulator
MNNPQNARATGLSPTGRLLREAALDRHFDHAALNFFLKYSGEPPGLSLHEFMSRFERAVVFETLVKTHGNQKETANFLKVKKQTLSWKVKKQHILITKLITKQPV